MLKDTELSHAIRSEENSKENSKNSQMVPKLEIK